MSDQLKISFHSVEVMPSAKA